MPRTTKARIRERESLEREEQEARLKLQEEEKEYLSDHRNFKKLKFYIKEFEMKCKSCDNWVWRQRHFAGRATCEDCRVKYLRDYYKR